MINYRKVESQSVTDSPCSRAIFHNKRKETEMFSAAFTATYERYVREIRTRKPRSVLVSTPAKWYALVLAWRDTTKSTCWSGMWKGPGIYKLSGFNDDRGYPVASVKWEKESPQMEFNL